MPVTLLVLAPERAVARWASQRIELEHPGYVLRPIVIGYAQIIAIVSARLPALRDEVEVRIRDQPEARLLQLVTELDQVHDEAGVRALLDERPESAPQ